MQHCVNIPSSIIDYFSSFADKNVKLLYTYKDRLHYYELPLVSFDDITVQVRLDRNA